MDNTFLFEIACYVLDMDNSFSFMKESFVVTRKVVEVYNYRQLKLPSS